MKLSKWVMCVGLCVLIGGEASAQNLPSCSSVQGLSNGASCGSQYYALRDCLANNQDCSYECMSASSGWTWQLQACGMGDGNTIGCHCP